MSSEPTSTIWRLWPFSADLLAHGITPVIVASGRPDHRHLFAAVLNGELRALLIARAAALGLNLTSSLRPPLTPHRLGWPVRLLSPAEPADALGALAPPTRRPLHPRVGLLLREGDTQGTYVTTAGNQDRSAVLAAIVTSAIDRGWSAEEAYRACISPKNKGGAKLQERRREHGELAARRYFKRLWTEQVQFCRARPPHSRSSALTGRLDALVAAATFSLPWKMRGHSTWATLAACALVAADAGTDVGFKASYRQIAERSGLSVDTVKRTLPSLRRDGWLFLVRPGIGMHGSIWRLAVPVAESVPPAPSNPGRLAPPGGALGLLGAGLTLGHDAFRWRAFESSGLGKSSLRLMLLLALNPAAAKAVAARLSISLQAAQRALRKLRTAGLASRDLPARVHRRADIDLKSVAAVLGTSGAGAVQQRKHEGEREAYRETYAYRRYRHGRTGRAPVDPYAPARPPGPCPTCGADDWWRQSSGAWVCGVCHPDPSRHPQAPGLTATGLSLRVDPGHVPGSSHR